MTADQQEPRSFLEPLLLRRALGEGATLTPVEREALLWLRFVRWVALVSALGGAVFLVIAIRGRIPPAGAAQAAPQPARPAQPRPQRPQAATGTAP